MVESGDLTQSLIPHTNSILNDLTTKMTEVLTRAQTSPQPLLADSSTAPIGIKLEGSNYALWSQVVEMYISGKDKLGYINGDSPQPPKTDPSLRIWRTENAIVKGWLINSMDPSLIANFIRFPTTKQVWDSAATTYFDGTVSSQVYDLRRRVTRMKQGGGSIEKYYNDLQGLWQEIDFRRPNPMECAIDIQKYNSILQEDRVYTFLDGLDDRLDKTRSDVLQLKPFPTVEQAYAFVRKEDVRQIVMISGTDTTPGGVMISKGIKGSHYQTTPKPGALSLSRGKSKTKPPSDGMKCTHCGNSKHTRDTCFKLHGYPDWWNDFQARKKRETFANDDHTGRAVVVTCDPSLSLIPQVESSHDPSTSGTSGKTLHISTHNNDDDWILNSGATYHMTFYSNDFSNATQSRRSCVKNANGVAYPITGVGTVTLSPSLSLSNTLLVPSLSNRLMSNGTAERKNRHILETTRALLINAHVPNRYWSDAVATAVHLLNRMPTKVLQFQTLVKGEIHGEERNWLDVEMLDVGDNLAHPNDGNDMVEPPRIEVELVPESSEDAESDESLHSLVPNDHPSENIPEKNNTWVLSVLPERRKTVGCKWIFSIKYKADGSIDQYKARLVAKGCTQKYGIDYQETFSPVAKLKTVRVLLSLAANLDWPLHQLDVKNAFLHGDLEKEIYMDLPPGYTATSEAKIACSLQRALYGLKQSPRAWFGRFSSTMRKYGFQQSNSDHTLFLKHQVGKITALIVYVDDMIITGDDVEEISKLQEQLSTEFEMKNL
ncbi:hypothetical protein VitviT2T_026277 [Vitis vinifera]|uniref:Retrovirus-related Pol polyprotein from transposon RE1 n=1 Tax=Vitis vinifera TaxID=29760 RepID=A0ABY9DQ85_VITVI|nr:hypothetical protein VitviT2T_026277 [Vitis vinifera]